MALNGSVTASITPVAHNLTDSSFTIFLFLETLRFKFFGTVGTDLVHGPPGGGVDADRALQKTPGATVQVGTQIN
jgi:hypothetical protein